MRLLAIDPGFERVGIAVIEHVSGKKDTLLFSECFKTNKDTPFHDRLARIGTEVERIIDEYEPQAMAIEKLYFATNKSTAMGVAEARGVIVYNASNNDLDIYEYTPPQIKLAVTGYGKADKHMVMTMVPKLISLEKNTKSDDELDAIAIGLTCLATERFSTGGSLLQRK